MVPHVVLGATVLFLVVGSGRAEFRGGEEPFRHSREVGGYKKFLVFPQGSNVQLVYCLTISTYAKTPGSITVGVTAGLAYELPHRGTLPHRKPAEVYHRRSRRELYGKIEKMLGTQGRNGKECVFRALCRAGRRDQREVGRGSFLQEIAHSVFSLPAGVHEEDPETEYERAHRFNLDCERVFPACSDDYFPF
ncbi:uncharacterized protein LOC105701930 [Orussus abietinus]|uniref:uncharacterized protein LOC105701930 n=1 Tax=Orussus abietinus TaxID=222816 RepID=UPI0006268D2D|nr:uncharacterized protein LOC105701930 [Orussus abietinus]